MAVSDIAKRIGTGIVIGNVKITYGSLLMIIGGIVSAMGFFLGWVLIEPVVGQSSSPTGLSMLTEGAGFMGIGSDGLGFAKFLPLLALVFGVLCVVISVYGTVREPKGRIIPAAQMVLGLLAFACAMAFTYMGGGAGLFTGTAADLVRGMIDADTLTVTVSIGNFVTMTGGLLALIGGGLNLRDTFDLQD